MTSATDLAGNVESATSYTWTVDTIAPDTTITNNPGTGTNATFNFTATVFGPVGYLVLFCVILFYVVVIVVWLAVERRAIREELRDEVPAGTITSQEYAMLPSYFRTTGYYLGLIFTGRLGAWLRARNLNATAVDLALAKRLARRSGSQGSIDRVRMLREKILDLREGATVRAAS
jgi:hypothetical protein